ncbi:hypothetical protein NONO_c09680 [Nocardia nova SH22a]|uniref:Uncharacterized protein n=1 Tax=Nocardia nova SH22a TaxID=1415166 RepID=W5T8X6_9NOCA|nr:hypothetical protein [Nocardia nova]AHH15775.1 hypothetical protein NONO_c09680 [Nocardia nova SH22a]
MRRTESSSTGIDKLLDTGKEGLNFFGTFVPRYKAWTGANPAGGDEAALTTRYDQQRGMDVEPLRTIGTAIGQGLDGTIGDAIRIQQLRLSELPARWSGSPGADNAAQLVQRVNGLVGGEHDNLSGIAQALSAAAEQLENVVRTKADAVRVDFATATLADRTADQIDKVIACARGDFGGVADVEEQRTKVREILPEIGTGDEPATYAKDWLDRVFVPALDGKIAAFTTLTDATHTAVNGVYEQLGGALESLGASPYTGPDGQPSAATSLQSGQPGNSSALFGSNPSVTPAALITTAPAAVDGTDPSASKPTATPISAVTSDTPLSQAAPVAATVPAAAANSGQGQSKQSGKPVSKNQGQGGAQDQGQGGAQDQSQGGAQDQSQGGAQDQGQGGAQNSGQDGGAQGDGDGSGKGGGMPQVTDMGKVGEWRPGDIANVLTAASQITGTVPDLLTHIGDPLKAVGELFKDVVGSEGITGLIHEGVDAATKIDQLVDHHAHPGEAAEQAPDPGNGNDPNGDSKGPQDNSQGHGEQPGHGGQADHGGQPGRGEQPGGAGDQSGPPQNSSPAGHEGKSIAAAPTQQPAAPAQGIPIASAPAAPNASSAMSPSGFLGGHGAPARSEGEQEHRPKIQYTAPDLDDGPAFVDAAEPDHPRAHDTGNRTPPDPAEPQPITADPDEADAEPEVQRA